MWLDRAVGWLGLQRKSGLRASSWSAADSNRLLLDWVWSHLSADQEIRGDLLTLRGRARELVRNTSWGRRYIQLLRNNVVGHKGVRLQARLQNAQGLPRDTINRRIEASWAEWGKPEHASVDRRLSWRGLQSLLIATVAQDGEALVRLVRGFENPFAFALQPIDPDLLDHTLNRPRGSSEGNEIRMGVEVNDWGEPVAYHLFATHPSELGSRERIRVPADQIIHLYDPYRVNQTRGVTWLAPVMLDLNMLRGYYEAELVASRIAAAKGGFFTSDGENGQPPGPDAKKLTMDAEPGVFDELPPGMQFTPWDPQHPNAAFKDFSSAMLRSIATGLGVSYTSLTNDLSSINFSSIRAGLLDERDGYRWHQQWLIEHLHRRVYAAWVEMGLLSGQLDLRLQTPEYFRVEWQPRGWPWVDPLKDIQASVLAVEQGFDSRKRVVGEQGRDLEEVFDDLKAEQALAKEKGIAIAGAASGSPDPESDADTEEIEDDTPTRNGSGRLRGFEPLWTQNLEEVFE